MKDSFEVIQRGCARSTTGSAYHKVERMSRRKTMDLRIKKMTIENFKGIKSLEVEVNKYL